MYPRTLYSPTSKSSSVCLSPSKPVSLWTLSSLIVSAGDVSFCLLCTERKKSTIHDCFCLSSSPPVAHAPTLHMQKKKKIRFARLVNIHKKLLFCFLPNYFFINQKCKSDVSIFNFWNCSNHAHFCNLSLYSCIL